MADVDDILARLEQALEIYGRILDTMKANPDDATLLDDARKKMRWAIKDLATKVWRLEKQ